MNAATDVAMLQDQLQRVLRFLLARDPRRAEIGYECTCCLARYRNAGNELRGKWVRFEGGMPGYRWVNHEETEGRTVLELPAAVAPEDVVTIPVDPNSRNLLQWVRDIGDQLRIRIPSESKAALDRILANVEGCYAEDYEKRLLDKFVEQGLVHSGSRDQERQFVKAFLQGLDQDYDQWKVSGDTLAVLFLVVVVARSLIDTTPPGNSTVGFLDYFRAAHLREPSLLGLCGLLSQFGAFPPRNALAYVFDLILRENHLNFLIRISRGLKSEGDRDIEAALNASDLPSFHHILFRSISKHTSAKIAFDYLRNNNLVTDVGLKEEFQRESVLGCEEKIARAITSLSDAPFDVEGRRLRRRRAAIQKARQEHGTLAAERLITQYIELEYYYPRCFRKYLEV